MSANIQTEQDLTEAEKFHRIIHDIYTNPRPHEDKKDNSNHPSYRKFKLPYHVQCAIRYENAKRAYEDQFQREINKLIALQSSGYEAARMNRHLCITSIWPPLHSRHDIDYTHRHYFTLNRKERTRLQWILTTNII